MLDWESLARAQFRQGVSRDHNLGALAMNKRGGGRAAVVKVEAPVPAVIKDGSSGSSSSSGPGSAALTDGPSSDGSYLGGSSSTLGDQSQSMDISSSLPGSSDPPRDSSAASNAAALEVGLQGVGVPDIVNR